MNEELNKKRGVDREIVVPGDIIGEGLKAGVGTYRDGREVYASCLGLKKVKNGYGNVIPLSGKYMPRRGDLVVGIITDMGATSWYVDINSAYPAPLHVNEVPWEVDFGDTARYMQVGDTALFKVKNVDETKTAQLTMKERGLRKLSGGQIIEIAPPKVPRVIGRGASMISMLKEYTKCRIFVGQNGRIWIDGELKNMLVAITAIFTIEKESHISGLTEKIEAFLKENMESSEV